MKIIHCADVHLGSAMDSRFPPEKAEERRRELRASFSALADYAKENGVGAVIIAGDLFDSGRPLKRDKEFFYGVVKNNPQIDFLYLRGNHDELQSYTEAPQNLKTFSEEWQSYSYGDIVVSGIEITSSNRVSLYSSLCLDGKKTNIVTLHGQIGAPADAGGINLSRLAGKNIDYLALGHLHAFSQGALDSRGIYAYSGCLEGRGFDEAGEKGFILLDIQNGKAGAKCVPFAKRAVRVAEFNG
ncbi:MAG: metallophosphoesterase, partial [Clostridia bacterium]|nr:metallophosphoesterase [Clostridia bacterium]